MSDLCGGCAFRPTERTGPRACAYTAGYGAFLHRHRHRLSGNARLRRAVQGLDRLADLEEVLRQERRRGDEVP